MTWANWNQMCVLLIKNVEGCSTEDFLSPLWFMALPLTPHQVQTHWNIMPSYGSFDNTVKEKINELLLLHCCGPSVCIAIFLQMSLVLQSALIFFVMLDHKLSIFAPLVSVQANKFALIVSTDQTPHFTNKYACFKIIQNMHITLLCIWSPSLGISFWYRGAGFNDMLNRVRRKSLIVLSALWKTNGEHEHWTFTNPRVLDL